MPKVTGGQIRFPKSIVKQQIYDFIRKHPNCPMSRVKFAAYAHLHIDKERSNITMWVHISQMNKHLNHMGERIVTRPGADATYKLIME